MSLSRRHFLERSFGSCCGFYATLLLAPTAARQAFAQNPLGKVIAAKPFARIEKLSEGVWGLISTPFDKAGGAGDRTTHSNGGLIVGQDRVLAVDSYRTVEGARYLAQASKFLCGRLPTHVVHTHFHFDHLGGTQGLIGEDSVPEVIMTQATRELAFQAYSPTTGNAEGGFEKSAIGQWGGRLTDATQVLTDETQPLSLDLGGRTVTIQPMSGHTASDLVVRDDQTGVTFGGDLIWDGIFPNFMSSLPSVWKKSVESILNDTPRLIVPGHGDVQMSDAREMKTYLVLLEEIDAHAKAQWKMGVSAEEAAKRLTIPKSAGDWQYFRDGFHEVAMSAWYRELQS